MDYKLFLGGSAFLLVAFLTYRYMKTLTPAEKRHDWALQPSYVSLWGMLITFVILGIIFILQSLPS